MNQGGAESDRGVQLRNWLDYYLYKLLQAMSDPSAWKFRDAKGQPPVEYWAGRVRCANSCLLEERKQLK